MTVLTLAAGVTLGILAGATVISAVFWIQENYYSYWPFKKKVVPDPYALPYDPKSPMVKRFQYLAGITNSYEDAGGYLRHRFNRIRSTSYNSYGGRFDLRNMY